LQQADHLDQPRREDLLLRNPDLKPRRKRTHDFHRSTGTREPRPKTVRQAV
jgi:hypothetical protein